MLVKNENGIMLPNNIIPQESIKYPQEVYNACDNNITMLNKNEAKITVKEHIIKNDIVENNQVKIIRRPKMTNELADINANWIDSSTNQKTMKTTYKIIHGILAEHIIKTVNFIHVRDNAINTTFIYMYIDGYYNLISDKDFQGFILKYIPIKIQKSKDTIEVFDIICQHATYINIDDLNKHEDIINFKDCIYNIKTCTIHKHSPKYLSTIRIDCNCPYNNHFEKNIIFDKYINDLSDCNEDKKSLILQFMGMALSNISGYRTKKSLFMVGPGNTGKSQIKELLTKIIGRKYCCSMDLKELEERFSTSQIYGKRLLGSNDMSFMTVKELKTFKKIVGGDTIYAEFKGKNGFDFQYKGIVWFCCNELPRFGGDKGEWVYNRIIPVQCNTVIEEEKQITTIVEDMLKEKEYIVFLALEELKKVIKNNYKYIVPNECNELLKKYTVINNSFLNFIEECTVERKDNKINDNCTCKRLYDVYVEWCKDNNSGYKESKNEVKKILQQINKNDIKILHGSYYWSKFTLSLATKQDYLKIYGYDSIKHSNNNNS